LSLKNGLVHVCHIRSHSDGILLLVNGNWIEFKINFFFT
jgi:hypothetical protein